MTSDENFRLHIVKHKLEIRSNKIASLHLS